MASTAFTVPVSAWAYRETDAAILVQFEETFDGQDERETWIPQSQIADDSEVWHTGDSGTLIVSHWFARQRGWTED